MGILAVQRRVRVCAARHHQPVETADHVGRLGVAGQLDRQPAYSGYALWIFAEVEVDLLAVECPLR